MKKKVTNLIQLFVLFILSFFRLCGYFPSFVSQRSERLPSTTQPTPAFTCCYINFPHITSSATYKAPSHPPSPPDKWRSSFMLACYPARPTHIITSSAIDMVRPQPCHKHPFIIDRTRCRAPSPLSSTWGGC